MDAEIETVDGVIDAELVPSEPTGLIERARSVAANPRVQGAAAATAGMVVTATTLALFKRVGAGAARRANPGPVGPSTVSWPPGPTVGPIAPGTYIIRVRAIGAPPHPPSR